MTLLNGSDLIDNGVSNILSTPLPFWDDISMYNLIVYGMFATIITGFAAKLINKRFSEASLESLLREPITNETYGSDYFEIPEEGEREQTEDEKYWQSRIITE